MLVVDEVPKTMLNLWLVELEEEYVKNSIDELLLDDVAMLWNEEVRVVLSEEDNSPDLIDELILDDREFIKERLLLVNNEEGFVVLLDEEYVEDSFSELLLEDEMFIVAIRLLL